MSDVIKSEGYGYVNNDIMRDDSVSIEARAIYSYFRASDKIKGPIKFNLNKRIACDDLVISLSRFNNHLDKLMNSGIVRVVNNDKRIYEVI